jgi:hypothetical protein
MKHKHAEFIKLMADGARIEVAANGEWIGAYWGDFNDNNNTFRISPNQPADEEGWIPWFGGDNPAVGKLVDIFSRGGNDSNWLADNLDWRHTKGSGDITRYRIVKQKKWRWMYTNKHNTGTEGIYLTPLLTEKEIKKWKESFSSCAVGPRQDWTEVECDGL